MKKSYLLFSLICLFCFSTVVFADENCPSFKTEQKCEDSNTCSWDSESKSCKEISVDDVDTSDPLEEPEEKSKGDDDVY